MRMHSIIAVGTTTERRANGHHDREEERNSPGLGALQDALTGSDQSANTVASGTNIRNSFIFFSCCALIIITHKRTPVNSAYKNSALAAFTHLRLVLAS